MGFIKKFSETKYSKDKEYINAVITSDLDYKFSKNNRKKMKLLVILYGFIILFFVGLSIAFLAVPTITQSKNSAFFSLIEILVFIILSIDLGLRWYTSEVRMKKGNWSYFLFPFTISGIILIVSLLPSLYLINIWTKKDIEIFRIFEHMKFLRIFRIITIANIIPGISIFRRVLLREKRTLLIVFTVVIITIVLFAVVIYNVETSPDAIAQAQKDQTDGSRVKDFMDSIYFSTISLTTIGFGDFSPVTASGKVVLIVMSIIGIAVLATPAGIITSGFVEEIKAKQKEHEKEKSSKDKK